MVLEQVYIEIHGMEERNLAFWPKYFYPSVQNSCSWALHTADQTQNMLESSHIVTFILQENIWGVNPSLILHIMKKTPWEAYFELDELDSIAVYKAHVKSAMNPDWEDWTFRG